MALSFFSKIKESLVKTRNNLMNSLESILPFGAEITEDVLDEVEEILYEADLGVHAAETVVNKLRDKAGEIKRGGVDPYDVIRDTIVEMMDCEDDEKGLRIGTQRPYVICVVGVNGAGKTTTVGKLALQFKNQGYSVLLAACDTFRAAAVEQLGEWAERSGAEFIKASIGADAASVAFDALSRARARGTDIVLIDTAGRLHTSKNLMDELKKIHKVISKADETAPHETLIVLDATTGQNALVQAETFNHDLGVSGIALTKLDGTAKGGIVVSIVDKLGIPVKLIGVGEGIDDLRDFDPADYARALLARNGEGQ